MGLLMLLPHSPQQLRVEWLLGLVDRARLYSWPPRFAAWAVGRGARSFGGARLKAFLHIVAATSLRMHKPCHAPMLA